MLVGIRVEVTQGFAIGDGVDNVEREIVDLGPEVERACAARRGEILGPDEVDELGDMVINRLLEVWYRLSRVLSSGGQSGASKSRCVPTG